MGDFGEDYFFNSLKVCPPNLKWSSVWRTEFSIRIYHVSLPEMLDENENLS
jgi:hypothetical protein